MDDDDDPTHDKNFLTNMPIFRVFHFFVNDVFIFIYIYISGYFGRIREKKTFIDAFSLLYALP